MSSKHQDFLAAALEAAQTGGKILHASFAQRHLLQVDHKAEFDFVTAVDRESEAAIVSCLRRHFPRHAVLAEEGGVSGGDQSEVQWIIDPLDGTANFIHGVPQFAVAIAARERNQIVAGVVLDPLHDEMYTAILGAGAFLNGTRIQVTASTELHQCLLGTGFPFRAKVLLDSYLWTFRAFFGRVRDMRRFGAASLDLAYVAAGRFDAFWEYNLNLWDFAAGELLVREAGGLVTGFASEDDFWHSGNILASNGKVHELLQAITRTGYEMSLKQNQP
ncbi:MAG: inositol monophosphatase family protein [bacterium]